MSINRPWTSNAADPYSESSTDGELRGGIPPIHILRLDLDLNIDAGMGQSPKRSSPDLKASPSPVQEKGRSGFSHQKPLVHKVKEHWWDEVGNASTPFIANNNDFNSDAGSGCYRMSSTLLGPFQSKKKVTAMPPIRVMHIRSYEEMMARSIMNPMEATAYPLPSMASSKQNVLSAAQIPGWTPRTNLRVRDRRERAATNMGFNPSGPVVAMHREVAPWLVDPSRFVAFARGANHVDSHVQIEAILNATRPKSRMSSSRVSQMLPHEKAHQAEDDDDDDEYYDDYKQYYYQHHMFSSKLHSPGRKPQSVALEPMAASMMPKQRALKTKKKKQASSTSTPTLKRSTLFMDEK